MVDAGKDIRFDGWTLNRQSGELLKDGVRVRLQTHPQQVLEALLERPGELVSREQLIARLWPKGVVDFDTALNSTVRRLRIALGDDADTPRYIETLPRRGYRFIGTLAPPDPVPVHAPITPGRARRGPIIAAIAVLALAVAVAAVFAWQRTRPAGEPAGGEQSQARALAVEASRRARFLLNRRDPQDVERAQRYFEEAIQHDPGYALGWSGLASAAWIMTIEGRTPRAQGLSRVRDAAERALELDPTLAEPHVRLANYRWLVGDSDAAQVHARRAMELEPGNPLVLGSAAGRAADSGRMLEAVALQRRAVEAEPLSAVSRYNLATMLYVAGELDATEMELRRLLELAPEIPNATELLALVLVRKGRHEDALALVAGPPSDAARLQVRALANFALGRHSEADAALAALISVCSVRERYMVAEVYAFRGELEQAFAWLEPAAPGDVGAAQWFEAGSPFLRPLHSDPRWSAWIGAS